MAQNDTPESRTSSPSLSERVRSITALRARFSSASRTTLVDDHDAEAITADESDHASSIVERHKSVLVPYTGDHIFEQLQPNKSFSDRVKMVEQIASNVGSYPLPVLRSIWRPIQDMYHEGSPLDARRVCFSLANAMAGLRDVPVDVQQQLYKIITVPVSSDLLESQVRSLKTLTKKGVNTDPFSPDIGRFLTTSLKWHFASIVEIRRRNRTLASRDSATSWTDRGLLPLFNLIAYVEKQNPQAIENKERSILLQELFSIAEKTSSKNDMQGVVTVLGPIVRASGIPLDLRRRCVELLCAICNAVESVRKDTKASLFFLLRSDCKDDIVQILLETLSLAPNERHTSIVCGALTILLELIRNKGQDELPLVTFGRFIEPFSHVHYGSRTTRCACLQTISELLANSALQNDILGSDWKFMIDTILTATGDEIYEPGQTQPLRIERQNKTETISHGHNSEPYTEQLKEQVRQKKLADAISDHLEQIASSFNSLWSLLGYKQRSLVARFYSELVDVLPEHHLFELFQQILSPRADKMDCPMDEQEVLPSTTYYESFDAVMDLFVKKHRIPPSSYGRAMQALRKDLRESHEKDDQERVSKLDNIIKVLLSEFETVQLAGWQKALELAETVAASWKLRRPMDFEAALHSIRPLIYARSDEENRQKTKEADAESLSSVQHGMARVTLAFVGLFLDYLHCLPYETMLLYNKFIDIASDKILSASIRLPALRLLARIRCDAGGAIFITPEADSLNLAAYLKRTEDTRHQLATFQQSSSQMSSPARAGRTEGVQELRRSRKSIDLLPKPIQKLPLWIYPGGPGLPRDPLPYPSGKVFVYNNRRLDYQGTFNLRAWLITVNQVIQHERDWEVYSYVIVHLPSQLANPSLFVTSFPEIKKLRKILVSQLLESSFFEPPKDTNVKKGDVACCLLQILTILLGYAEKDKQHGVASAEYFQQNEEDELVKVFLYALGTWDRAGQICIQALTTACHAIPVSVTRTIGAILDKFERKITATHLTVDILEFLANVARSQQIHANIIEEDHRRAFAICIKYLEFAREERARLKLNNVASRDYASSGNGISIASASMAETKDQDDRYKDLPQYVFVLAYHVITNWFLSLKLQDRSKYVGSISSKLAWKDAKGVERMEEQSQVTLDMMLRTAYSDLPESQPAKPFTETDGEICKRTWLVGLSIVTVETALKTGITHITKRQISGTTYTTYIQNTVQLAEHHVALQEGQNEAAVQVFPQHIFTQLTASISPVPSPLEPVYLPENDISVEKALSVFDRMDTVDGYCIGVVYVRDNRITEQEILCNTTSSCRFERFMKGMGTRVALRGATFNTHGLDKELDQDGSHTYAWRDRLVEIVYAIPSMMPTYDHDRQGTNKKRHVGNSFVTVVWNDSGHPYKFDTISSQFNSVVIVITPENSIAPSEDNMGYYFVPPEPENADKDDPRYKVETITHSLLPRLSPCASTKLLPLKSLPGFVRQVALNCAIFSNVWSARETGEYTSSWRGRLRAIVNLHERYAGVNTGGQVYKQGEEFKGKIEMGGITEVDGVRDNLDFSRWAGNIPVPPIEHSRTSSQVEASEQNAEQGI